MSGTKTSETGKPGLFWFTGCTGRAGETPDWGVCLLNVDNIYRVSFFHPPVGGGRLSCSHIHEVPPADRVQLVGRFIYRRREMI